MKSKTNRFTQFIPNIEQVPFSDIEACNILNIPNTSLYRAAKIGLIQKSVEIQYRFDITLKFLSLFDIYEYALRSNLFFLNYGSNSDVNELVYGLVDELAFIIDNCNSGNAPPQMKWIKRNLEDLCRDDSEKWTEYWLYDGDTFSEKKCSAIALQTWCEVFEKTMRLISPLEEYLVNPWNGDENAEENLAKQASKAELASVFIQ